MPHPTLQWSEADTPHSARWRCERGSAPPRRVLLADDTTPADTAFRLANEGTGLLWRGDFQNARHLLDALVRRADHVPARHRRKSAPAAPGAGAANATAAATSAQAPHAPAVPPAQAFHLHRQAQAQRARVLAAVLIPLDADYRIPLRRAPDWRAACSEAWGPPGAGDGPSVVSLRELLGLLSAHEWRKKGVPIPALGPAPDNRIHPHYGVFSPVRGEYVQMVADAPLPAVATPGATAFDIGTGTGVLAALLAKRGLQVLATDTDPRALACAAENITRLNLLAQVQVLQADLFPPGRAALVLCNPPWLPARAGSPLERAVYDENSHMLQGWLQGLAAHLVPGGEGWLVLSDLAEHLGLRSRAWLLQAIQAAGLQVLGRIDTRPVHRKVADTSDALHAARAAEVTSLWRLGAAA